MYAIYGEETSKKIIIAIPALGERKEMFKPLADQLNRYKWIVLDLPGHNGYETEDFSIESYIEKMREILLELDVNEVNFIGNSLGAWVIQGFAKKYPNSIKSLTLLDGGYYFLGERKENTEEVSFPLIENFDDIRTAVHELTYSMEGLENDAYIKFEAYFLDNYIKEGEFYKHHSNENAYNELAEEVTAIDYCLNSTPLPIALIIAENNLDEFSKRKLQEFIASHPTAKVEIIKNGYHYLPLTNTSEIAELIRNNL